MCWMIRELCVGMSRSMSTTGRSAIAALPARSARSSSRSQTLPRNGQELKGHAFFAYAANYLIDLDHAVIIDVKASRAIRQAEVGACAP
jgi:hypothetical protein